MNKEQKISTNIKVPNNDLENLKKHFPQCFKKDGNFDFEKFKTNLKENEINFTTESYRLDWLGKSYARLLASDPATTLLKADETHNQKPENANSENLLIKGDNLEVLKHLANAYYEKVKMIYIDPPYNTGSDGFVYNDDRKFTAKELQNLIGVDEEKAKRILSFTQSKSNSHSAWLTFLYPRLYIAKQLLKDDGVIFVSIDDNEVAQLRLLMDEIFGEENFVSVIPRIAKRTSDKGTYFRPTKDYILAYSKNINNLQEFGIKKDRNEKDYNQFEENGRKYKQSGASLYQPSLDSRPNQRYYIEAPDGSLIIPPGDNFPDIRQDGSKIKPKSNNDKVWRWSVESYLKQKHLLIFTKGSSKNPLLDENGNQSKWNIYPKVYYDEDIDSTLHPEDVIYDFPNSQSTKELNDINIPFSFAKPSNLIKFLLNLTTTANDFILDFFAGSGTTGDAVMQLNAEDGGNRKYILVQLPEAIDLKKNKTAYDFVKNDLKAEPTIFEITKERLIRAAKKVNEELDEKTKNLKLKIKNLETEMQTEETKQEIETLKAEITKNSTLKTQNSFKIFETTPIWDDYDFEAEQFDTLQTLFDVGKLTNEDIKALLTTWKTYDGIALTQDLETITLDKYIAYYGNQKLYLMNKGFITDNLKNIFEKIDSDKTFNPTSIIAFGYHFDSKNLRELSENLKSTANKKKMDIDFIIRY